MKHPAARATDTDITVAEYVCGLLDADERAQVHGLLARDDEALKQALAWEERLLALVDALPRVTPAPALRERLQRTLGIGPPPAEQPPPPPQLLRQRSEDSATRSASSPVKPAATAPAPTVATPVRSDARPEVAPAASNLEPVADAPPSSHAAPPSRPAAAPAAASARPNGPIPTSDSASGKAPPAATNRHLVRQVWLWRLVSLCAGAAAVAGFMLPGEPPPPPVQIVKVAPTRAAILQAPGSTSTPGWTATLDPQGNLLMQPHVHTEVPVGRQVMLWTRSRSVPEPRSLGRIDPNRPVQVPAAQLGSLADDQLLEITLERDEDAARGVAHGPILFIGQMTVFGSETAPTQAQDSAASAAGGAITQQPAR